MTMKPHPRSYRADLPLSSTAQTRLVYDTRTGKVVGAEATTSLAAWADKVVRDSTPAQNKTRAVPRSLPLQGYRPDLPTFGFSCTQLMRATNEDKAAWDARPLTYAPAGAQLPYAHPCPKCGGKTAAQSLLTE